MGMGAASSSRCITHHHLSHQGHLMVEKLGNRGKAALQRLAAVRIDVVTPPLNPAECLPLSTRRFLSCPVFSNGGAGRASVCIARFSAPIPMIQGASHLIARSDSIQLRALAVEAAPTEMDPPAENEAPSQPGRGDVDWAVARWVVFSDLHLSRRTLDVCLHTLNLVHQEAVARDAGILFLGDFWHERGALPVEPLNRVLQVVQAWQRPTLMIPGNHDQVSIGGEVHSLTPLEAASPFIRVLHEPTVVQGALFVPYRRDHQLVLDAMRDHTDVKAVFAHIDVAGAFLNNSFQAKDGIAPAALRSDVPIYTGHYHRPHSVAGTSVRYVGSPYQVSRSEAGQQKHLLVLDQDWQETEAIPLSVGPRHFSVTGASPELPEDLRAGDRLRWEVPSEWALAAKKTRSSDKAGPPPVAETLAELRRRGVEVEVVYPLPASKPRIQKAEELDAFSLFSQYAATVKLPAAATTRGHALLRELDLPARALRRPRADVIFRRLELEGYGPFLVRTDYCLGPARGLRAITGSILDGGGNASDSNGAGKTTLVMAPLWALTGSTDARPGAEGGLLLSEVVHPEASSARVRLEGDVNGRPFVVERTAGRRSGLRFEYDGEDRTQQEIRLTEDKINDLLDTASLRRIVFHGQHAVGGLLEANDRELKEELSRMVSMKVWVAAAEACRRQLKQQRSQLEHLQGGAHELRNRAAALAAEIERTESEQREFALWKEAQASQLAEQLAAVHSEQAATLQRCLEAAVRLDAHIAETAAILGEWEDSALGDALGPPGAGPTAAMSAEEEEAAALAQDAQMELVDKRAQARSAATMVEEARERLASFMAANADAVVCERCLQPVAGEHLAASIAAMRADLARREADHAQLQQEEAEMGAVLQDVRAILEDLRERRLQDDARRRSQDEQRRVVARQERQELQQARGKLAAAERERDDARSLDVAAFDVVKAESPAGGLVKEVAAGSSRDEAQSVAIPGKEHVADRARAALEPLQQATTAVHEEREAAQAAGADVWTLERRLEEVAGKQDPHAAQRDTLARMHTEAQAELAAREAAIGAGEAEVAVLRAVEGAVGLAGIQSYVLEGALAELEARTAALLDTLSGGTLVLHLAATRVAKTTKREQEKIDKVVRVRLSDGRVVDRSLRQLSGGERQRVAVAMQLAFADFAAERSGVHSDLIVLDEAFQHLDSAGRSRMLAVLRGLAQGSVLVVSQANGELAGMFDLVDTVVRDSRTASVAAT